MCNSAKISSVVIGYFTASASLQTNTHNLFYKEPLYKELLQKYFSLKELTAPEHEL